ncbi:MAG: PAS domain S-box protein [Candidatus Lokiarchaeota archaeon]|nr:PAS domain S-box protein [Candidatus Lokiarchaeota archaeon]
MASTSNFGYNIGDILKEYLDDFIFILNEKYEFEYSTDTLHLKNLGLISLGSKITDILHPEDFRLGMDFLQKLSKAEQALETLRVRFGEVFRFYEFKGRLFKNEAQETKYLITTQDITNRVKTERKSISFEKKYKQIIDNIKEAYYEVDLEGNFIFMNESFTQITGYSFDEMIGKNYAQLLDDENKKKVLEKFNSVYKSGLSQEYFKFESTKKGNTKIIVETSVYLNKDTTGKKLGFYGISRDITQRFNLELKLKQSEEKYRHLFDNSPYAIWIIDLNGTVVDCNSSTDIILSRDKRKDLIGKNFVEILGLFDRPEYYVPFFKSKFESFVRDEPMKALELKMHSNDGIEMWMIIRTSKIKLEDETLIQVIIQDITEKKKSDLNLQRSEEELKILNKELEKKVQERTKELRESEEKFRTITENSLMGVAIVQDNKVKYVNQQFATLAGYNVDELKEFSPMDIFQSLHPDDRKLVMEQLKKKQQGLKDYISHYQYRIFDKTGGIKWVDNYSKTINFMGSPADLISGIDITDRKKAEEELKESEEKYRHLYENSPFSIVLLNSKGKIIDMNPKTTELFGFKKEDLIDKNYLTLMDIFPKETVPELRLVQDLMSKGKPSNPIMKPQITKIYNKDKKPVWVESELSAVRISGELMILAIIQNITGKKLAAEKLKESEQILRQQNIEMKELDRLKTDFISIAAHDLKTPLISVGGYVDLILLREKELNEEVKEDLNRVLNNVRRLDGYINRLLDVMKIEAKKVELVKREENIHIIINSCLSDLEFQIGQKKLTINLDISENLKLRVDRFRISQVFLNLLSNAIKFTPKNGKIDVYIVEEDERILFKIKDNGKGLTPEEIQKIFGKFVTIEQGIDGYSSLDKGSGLGLYIAKGFIEAHGGKIWVESKGRDLGVEFSFTLPKL